MKTAITFIGYLLVALGIMAMAGSAGDCDGKCVENANTMLEMLTFAGIGLAMFLFGFMLICLLYTSPSPRDQRGSGLPACG